GLSIGIDPEEGAEDAAIVVDRILEGLVLEAPAEVPGRHDLDPRQLRVRVAESDPARILPRTRPPVRDRAGERPVLAPGDRPAQHPSDRPGLPGHGLIL